jgi:Fe-S cluster assembly protein SufD
MSDFCEKPFLESLKKLYQEKPLSSFDQLQTQAWDQFSLSGLPSRESSGYRHMRLRDLYSKEVNSCQKPTLNQKTAPATFVFVNGTYVEELSDKSGLPKELVVMPLSKAMRTFGSYLQGRFSLHAKEGRDTFAQLNTALFQEGLFIYLPPKCVVEVPIRIVHTYEKSSLFSLFAPRVHIFGGKECKADFIFSDTNEQAEVWSNSFIDLSLEERAHINLHLLTFQNDQAFHTESLRADLKKESIFNVFLFTGGAKAARKDFHVTLQGENANASLEGLWLLKGKREAHVNVLMDHAAPYTYSRQKFKGVLTDLSKSSFEGKIFVRENALKTEGFQANHNLVLSEKALCYTRPNLEIFADDVKASHGATIGTLDKDNLFYLKTRGMSEEVAKRLLVRGFIAEMIDAVKLEPACKAARSFAFDAFL